MPTDSSLQDRPVAARLKLGLLSYPVLQAADILVHRYVDVFLLWHSFALTFLDANTLLGRHTFQSAMISSSILSLPANVSQILTTSTGRN